MAGVTDKPFRAAVQAARRGLGRVGDDDGDPRLWHTRKIAAAHGPRGRARAGQRADRRLRSRRCWPRPRATTSTTARRSSTSTWAARRRRSATPGPGSALLRDEALVARILDAVVRAVDVPVTLKIRTGWDREPPQRPGDRAASPRMPASPRSRCTAARATSSTPASAEYDTIAAIKARARDPGDRQRRHRFAAQRRATCSTAPAATR